MVPENRHHCEPHGILARPHHRQGRNLRGAVQLPANVHNLHDNGASGDEVKPAVPRNEREHQRQAAAEHRIGADVSAHRLARVDAEQLLRKLAACQNHRQDNQAKAEAVVLVQKRPGQRVCRGRVEQARCRRKRGISRHAGEREKSFAELDVREKGVGAAAEESEVAKVGGRKQRVVLEKGAEQEECGDV